MRYYRSKWKLTINSTASATAPTNISENSMTRSLLLASLVAAFALSTGAASAQVQPQIQVRPMTAVNVQAPVAAKAPVVVAHAPAKAVFVKAHRVHGHKHHKQFHHRHHKGHSAHKVVAVRTK
jgi:hypothetical protein